MHFFASEPEYSILRRVARLQEAKRDIDDLSFELLVQKSRRGSGTSCLAVRASFARCKLLGSVMLAALKLVGAVRADANVSFPVVSVLMAQEPPADEGDHESH